MKTAYLGLGSNLGDRLATLREAVQRLRCGSDVLVTRMSSVYETAPIGLTLQPRFLNLVVEVQTTRPPRELLGRALEVEASLGRLRRERWGPRTVDIDLLWMEGEEMEAADLTLPHPRAAERGFVLLPLAEVAPELMFAGLPVWERARAHASDPDLRKVGPLFEPANESST